MEPESGKPLRLLNPLSIWTDLELKSGEAMLDGGASGGGAAESAESGGDPRGGRTPAAQGGARQSGSKG